MGSDTKRGHQLTQLIGMEGQVIVTQKLFKFEYLDETAEGKISLRRRTHRVEFKAIASSA